MVVTLHGCQIAPGVRVKPRKFVEPLFGLESVADVNPLTDPHMENGVEWEPYDCSMAEAYCNKCGVTGDPKSFHALPDLKQGLPFGVYGSFACSGGGFTYDERQERARLHLESGQWRRIEREFIKTLLNSNPVEPDTVNLTPIAGAVPVASGLALLEDWAGENIAGVPTIHLPRGAATLLAPDGLLVRGLGDEQERLRTVLGSMVSAGGGYDNVGPDGTAAESCSTWLYATGQVRIWLGEIFEPTDLQGSVDRENNDLLTLAERTVVAGYECSAAAIRVNIC